MTTNEITLAAPPNTIQAAAQMLASMAALNGAVTDYNVGSQVRTEAESIGAVIEQQGVWSQALAFQAIVYCALGLFGIVPGVATPASGVLLFTTTPAVSGGPNSPINVDIPSGTVCQTTGGIQFATVADMILLAGTSGITSSAVALVSGSAGNVAASGIIQIATGLAAPLFVTNPLPFGGGTDPTAPSQSLAAFAAQIASIGLSSPASIANAAIGVTYGNETCLYSTVYEPFLTTSGAGSGVAGYQLIVDDGTGTATSGLINNIVAKLNGGLASGATNNGAVAGYRDAGVPFSVLPVQATYAVVGVSGTVGNSYTESVVSGAISQAVSGYFTLAFGAPAEQGQIAAAVANASQGSLSSLVVSLYASGSPTAVSTLTPPVSGRVVLAALNLSLTVG